MLYQNEVALATRIMVLNEATWSQYSKFGVMRSSNHRFRRKLFIHSKLHKIEKHFICDFRTVSCFESEIFGIFCQWWIWDSSTVDSIKPGLEMLHGAHSQPRESVYFFYSQTFDAKVPRLLKR